MEQMQNSNPSPHANAAEPAAAAPQAAARVPYTPNQLWLLLGALSIGVAFRLLCDAPYVFAYGAFWLICLAVYLIWNRRALRHNPTGVLTAAAAAAVCLLSAFGLSREFLMPYDVLAIPLLLMLHMAVTTRAVPLRREGAAALAMAEGFFVYPFTAVPRFFGAIGQLFSGKRTGNAYRILAGLIIGLPLTVLVTALLANADLGMRQLVSGMLNRLEIGSVFSDLLIVLVPTVLFYSFLFNALYGKRKPLAAPLPATLSGVTLCIILTLLLAAYGAYAYVQFTYLFGGRLPQEMTYAAYARRGFSELITVSAINFTVYGVCVRFGKPNALVKALCALLLAATAMVIASGVTRLTMYINAYGLTIRRILPMWAMLYLAFATVLAAIRLYKQSMPLMRIAAWSFIAWFLLLHLPDWSAVIRAFNG